MDKAKLVEKINILGPWIHGYFDLGGEVVIQDRDVIQQGRLKAYRDYFIDIIRSHYGKKNLGDKTIAEVGCNAGYFLFELYKYFGFNKAVGLEPRGTNRAKARFIAQYFKLPRNRYQIKRFDVLSPGRRPPVFDVVLFPSVLHHIDNQLLALQNLYQMTKELCVIDTHVLPDGFNTPDLAEKLELKDLIYSHIKKDDFGVVGYKLEDDKLDGSTVHAGVVGIPTVKVLQMMLRHVGFSEVRVYRDWRQLKREVYRGRLYRDIYAAIVVAKKLPEVKSSQDEYDRITKNVQYQELQALVPLEIIQPCYRFIQGNAPLDSLPMPARLICASQCVRPGAKWKATQKRYVASFSKASYYPILQTFKYAPDHKIPFEYAKTCFSMGNLDEAKKTLSGLIRILNLDWRIVYKSYHVLSLILTKKGEIKKARECNVKTLRAFPSYYPALDFRDK